MCHEPDLGLSLAKRVKKSSESDIQDEVCGRELSINDNGPTVVVIVRSATTWQEDSTAKRKEDTGTKFPKYTSIHYRGIDNEPRRSVTVRSLELLFWHAVNEVKSDRMEESGARRFCQSTKSTGLEVFSYRRVFYVVRMGTCS